MLIYLFPLKKPLRIIDAILLSFFIFRDLKSMIHFSKSATNKSGLQNQLPVLCYLKFENKAIPSAVVIMT